MLQDLLHAFTEWGIKILEDKVGIAFRYSSSDSIWNVCSQDNVGKGEGGCRTVGKVRHCQGSWRTTVFVKQYCIAKLH